MKNFSLQLSLLPLSLHTKAKKHLQSPSLLPAASTDTQESCLASKSGTSAAAPRRCRRHPWLRDIAPEEVLTECCGQNVCHCWASALGLFFSKGLNVKHVPQRKGKSCIAYKMHLLVFQEIPNHLSSGGGGCVPHMMWDWCTTSAGILKATFLWVQFWITRNGVFKKPLHLSLLKTPTSIRTRGLSDSSVFGSWWNTQSLLGSYPGVHLTPLLNGVSAIYASW